MTIDLRHGDHVLTDGADDILFIDVIWGVYHLLHYYNGFIVPLFCPHAYAICLVHKLRVKFALHLGVAAGNRTFAFGCRAHHVVFVTL